MRGATFNEQDQLQFPIAGLFDEKTGLSDKTIVPGFLSHLRPTKLYPESLEGKGFKRGEYCECLTMNQTESRRGGRRLRTVDLLGHEFRRSRAQASVGSMLAKRYRDQTDPKYQQQELSTIWKWVD